ncbi:conserved hypothetical protein [Stenotrophomonas indicatrix]|nr:conserved hypothetical protein [Stenotrophomonas indicatrix]
MPPYSGWNAAMDLLMGTPTSGASARLRPAPISLDRSLRLRLMSYLARAGVAVGPLALITLSSACAPVSDTPAGETRPSASASRPADISMSELQRRLLAYADSLKSRADISPEKFGAAIGVSLVPDEKVSIRSVAKDLVITEGFNYAASYFSVESPRDYPRHSVVFYQLGKPSVTEAPGDVCYWDADSAGQALERLGYRGRGESPFKRGGIRHFWRPIGAGKKGMSTSLLTYRINDSAGLRTCVYEIRFSGGDM